MSFDIRGELWKSINGTDDPKDRGILVLMVGVLDRVEQLLSDDEAMRKRVLNGNYESHKDDHEWIREWRDHVTEWRDVCQYSKAKMIEEKAAQEKVKSRMQLMVDKALEHSVTIAITAAAVYVGFSR